MRAVFFLDKPYPAEHSFVDDFLATYFSSEEFLLVYQQSGISGNFSTQPKAENATIATLPRQGVKRFLNIFRVLRFLIETENIDTILVRNCPAMLLGAKLFCNTSRRAPKLIYMSSFDHEGTARGMKRWIALFMHRLLANKVKGLLAVSESGMSRLKKIYPTATSFLVIPLCASGKIFSNQHENWEVAHKYRTFIYGGSFGQERQLETVLKAFESALVNDRCRLILVGVNDALVADWLDRYPFCSSQNLQFLPKLPRRDYLGLLSTADFGLSLVPNSSVNEEMSPTKLLEYFDYSVPAIASDNVEFQHGIISVHGAGILTSFKHQDLEIAIEHAISASQEEYARMVAGAESAAAAFSYAAYEQPFRDFCIKEIQDA